MKIKDFFLKTILPALLTSGVVLLSAAPVSCRLTEEGIQMLTGDFTSPSIKDFEVLSDSKIHFIFSKEVIDFEACVSEKDSPDEEQVFTTANTFSNNNRELEIAFTRKTEAGKEYVLEGTAGDKNGNTLTFSIPFTGYNPDVPYLLLSEIRNAYSSSTDSSGCKKFKCEYIELYSVTEGNLCGLELISAGDGEEKKYCFPNCRISAGEFITVHLRTKEENCIDETGENLSESKATDSNNEARDFWVQNDKARLSSSDIILLKNAQSGEIMDCVLFAQSTQNQWPDGYEEICMQVKDEGRWLDEDGNADSDINEAVNADGITSSAVTRTLSRLGVKEKAAQFVMMQKESEEDLSFLTGSKNQWIVTATKGSGKNKIPGDTPGYENSTNPYSK